jgi:uncharacterized protein (TIGR03437 family)
MHSFARLGVSVGIWCFFWAITGLASVTNNSVLAPPNYNSFQPPAAGASYVDPVFGTTIKRISNARGTPNAYGRGNPQYIEPEYSTASPFNIDNSRLILLFESYFGLFDGQGQFLGALPEEINASSEPRWSRQDPNVLYYHTGNQLKQYEVSTNAASVVHTFTEFSSINGAGEMDISYDGGHFVLVGTARSPFGSKTYVFIYEISTDSKSPALDTSGRAFDSVYIAANNYVTISWTQSGTGRYSGIELFDSSMNFVRQLTDAGGHMHMSQDVNGDPVLIWTNSNDPAPACGQNAIVKIRLSDGRQTCLLSLDWNMAVHISAADNTWAFVETYAPSNPTPGASGWCAYTNELIQIKLDGSEVRRLAHHRSRPFDSYVYMPKLSISRDGSRLVYASNMDLQSILGYPQIYADTYMILTGTTVPLGVFSEVPGVKAAVNGASFVPQGPMSPALIGSIFGTKLARAAAQAQSLPLPTTLSGVTVRINDAAAPLFYVSPTQINFQVPWEVLGQTQASVTVTVNYVTSAPWSGTLAPATPGIFSINQQGSGQGAILMANSGALAAAAASLPGARPAQRGEYISIYCTGLGPVTNQPASGAAAQAAPLSTTLSTPVATIGGVPAAVSYAGLAPGFVGLYQVNAQVPANSPVGAAVPVTITLGGVASNSVTVAVQ